MSRRVVVWNRKSLQGIVGCEEGNNIWVAGGIANLNGTRIERWRVAQQHGRIAALAMLGEDATFDGVPFVRTYHFGKRLAYLGATKKWDEIVVDGDLKEMTSWSSISEGMSNESKLFLDAVETSKWRSSRS